MKTINKYIVATVVFILVISIAGLAQTHRNPTKTRQQTAKVLITEQGYSPGSLKLRRGAPAKVTFLRVTNRTCGTEIVIPAYGVHRPLPLNEPVVVSFTPRNTGEFGFACGMNMMHGKLIVQ